MVADITHPLISVNFLSHFSLLVDCEHNCLLDKVMSSVPVQATSSLIPSIKTISGGTLVDCLLTEFLGFTHLAGVHHIQMIPGPPVICQPQRLAPDQLAIAKSEFNTMLWNGTACRSESSWSSALHCAQERQRLASLW
jgi:hypothetical protein